MFSAEKTPNGTMGIMISNPTPEQRLFLRSLVTCNYIDDTRYKVSKQAGAFLQSYSKDCVFVEFWQPDYQPFVDYANAMFAPWVEESRESGLLEYLLELHG